MSLKNAFNFIILNQGHDCTLEKYDASLSITIKMAKSNRYRKLNFLDDTTHQGNEFVVSKDELDKLGFGEPIRGDRIGSPLIGQQSVTAVEPQIVFGSTIGYRLRCD